MSAHRLWMKSGASGRAAKFNLYAMWCNTIRNWFANDDPNIGANFDWTYVFCNYFQNSFCSDSRRAVWNCIVRCHFVYTIVEMESNGNQSDF